MTSKRELLEAAEARQAERVTEERHMLTVQDLEDLLKLARERPSFAGWCDVRTVAELARRALFAATTAPYIDDIADRTYDQADRKRLIVYARGLRS